MDELKLYAYVDIQYISSIHTVDPATGHPKKLHRMGTL